jgi:hypothetical protein
VLLATSAQFPDRAAATLVLAALPGGCLASCAQLQPVAHHHG